MRAIGCDPGQLFGFMANMGYEKVYEYIPFKHREDAGRPYNVVFENSGIKSPAQ
jgi:hypothetical protein